MNKALCLLFFCLCFLELYSQNDIIRGKVLDYNQMPIEFVNVVSYLLPDTIFYAGTITNANGDFQLAAKDISRIIIKVSFVGYKTVLVPAKNDLNIIMISTSAQLGEVEVKAIRPQVLFKNDRYEITIENSIAAQGNTMESLLQELPGVWTSSDGMISINGLSGAQVIINDKPVKLTGAPLMAYLGSLRSEDISKIEVIQRPSAMYDAEGGGIIHIITKQVKEEGISGTFSTKMEAQQFSGISPYLSLKYNKGKFGANFSLNGQKAKWLLLSDNAVWDLENDISYWSNTTDTIYDKNYSANADLYYDVNEYNKIAININYLYWGKDEYMGKFTDINGNNNSAIWQTNTNQKDLQDMNHYSFTLNYYLLLDTIGKKKITILSDYSNQYQYYNKSYLSYFNYDNINNLISREDLLNDQNSPYRIFSTEVKYDHKLGNGSAFKTGIKYSSSTVENDFVNYVKTNNNWLLNDNIGYQYQYDEQLVSTFFQFNIDKTRWSFLGGIRGEYTHGHIVDIREEEEKFNLFPSVYFDYNLDKKSTLGLSYTQRINRVSYMKLLPSRYYYSRYNIKEGNPLLTPNIVNNIGINYNYNKKYYFSVSYRWSDNAISPFNYSELIDNTSIIVSSYVDGVKIRNANLNAYLPVNITSWWSTVSQLNVNYNNYRAELLESYSNFNYNLYTRQTFFMLWDIRGEILYRYLSRSKTAYSESAPYHLLNASVFKAFLNKKLKVKFEAGRILYNQKMGSESETPTANTSTKMYYKKTPFFALTLSYSFSKGKSKTFQRIQQSNKQEKSRTY